MINNKRKNIIIISTIKLYKGNSAGSARMMNFARSIAINNPVYLLSYTFPANLKLRQLDEIEPNIFINKNLRRIKGLFAKILYPFFIFMFLRNVLCLSKELKSKTVFYLYPSTKSTMDFLVVLYLIVLKKQKVYYEVNEVRKYTPRLEKHKSFFKNPFDFVSKKITYTKYIFVERCTKYYTGLVCISTNIKQYFERFNTNTIRIPILSNININDDCNNTSPSYNDSGPFKICFAGMINVRKENLNLFFKSLSILKQNFSSFELHLYGPITTQEKKLIFEKILPSLGLQNNVFYKGIVDQKELISIYCNYHLLLLPRGNNLQNHYGFSTKLSEYLVSGIPVLVTNVSDNGLYIKDNENGFIIEPDNELGMADKLVYIIKYYNIIVPEIKRNALNTMSKHFDYRNYAVVLNDFLC